MQKQINKQKKTVEFIHHHSVDRRVRTGYKTIELSSRRHCDEEQM